MAPDRRDHRPPPPTTESLEVPSGGRPKLDLRLPDPAESLAQDEEWCELVIDGRVRRIRFHDYAEIYSIPGLYEQLFYATLDCRSPQTVSALLGGALDSHNVDPSGLRVLDVGAGNGMVGEHLARIGAGSIVGIDVLPEAAEATARDRPGVYEDYLVVDLVTMPQAVRADLAGREFNCLTSVAALGFDDIPPRAFAAAYNLVGDGGFAAFTIKETFLAHGDGTGFSGLVRRMLEIGAIELLDERRYRHRLSTAREPLDYVAIVAMKRSDVRVG